MKIRKSFNLTIIVTALLLLLGTSFTAIGMFKVQEILNERLMLGSLIEQLYSLKILTLEYVNNPSERTLMQWNSQYKKINMEAIHSSVTGDVWEAYRNIPLVFNEIAKTTERPAPKDNSYKITAVQNNHKLAKGPL